MAGKLGRRVSMSVGRRFTYDIIEAGRRIPLVTIQKDMNVTDLMEPHPRWKIICIPISSTKLTAAGSIGVSAADIDNGPVAKNTFDLSAN
jgi:hypothetical protein